MRTEAIQNEAKLYCNDGECYIHVERVKGAPYACVVAGDDAVIAQAIYNLLGDLAGKLDKTFPEILKLYRKNYRRIGLQKQYDEEYCEGGEPQEAPDKT